MLEHITEHIQELKNSVSLRYVDTSMREQALNFLGAIG
jgi:hypothetical protein